MTDLAELQDLLGVHFEDLDLLERALVHRSYLNEHPESSLSSNERLEFFGDAVLGFIVADELFRRFPDLDEGGLTRLRAALVRRETLADWAGQLNLGRYLYLGRGEVSSGGRKRQSILGCAIEALIGAIYLDRGLGAARDFILGRLPEGDVSVGGTLVHPDPKSRLQQLVQSRGKPPPKYRLVHQEGPAHARAFTIEVMVDGQSLGQGIGNRRRDAEQEAARHAILALENGQPES